jgi:hypothetical protein
MDAIHIVEVEQDGRDGVLVTFSDGTIAGYVVEELIGLRPVREWARATKTTPATIWPDPDAE